jgi:hypothetical protein
METPRGWNALRTWTYNVTAYKPKIFLLRDHITLIQDLINDWTSGPPPTMEQFIPMIYEYSISLMNVELRMNVNEHNVINRNVDLEENGGLVWLSSFYSTLTINDSFPYVNVTFTDGEYAY